MGPIGHTLSGISLYLGWRLARQTKPTATGIFFSGVLANLPDFDLIPALWVGFPRANAFHHSLTHTPAFALVAAVTGFFLLRVMSGKWRSEAAFMIFGCIAVHIAGDFFTRDTGYPYGEMIFWPFSSIYHLGPFLFLDIYKGSWNQLFSMQNLKSCVHELYIFSPIVAWLLLLGRNLPNLSQPERSNVRT